MEYETVKPQDEYTAKKPGQWRAYAAAHLPRVKIHHEREERNITVELRGTFDRKHYIEKIGIVDGNGIDLAARNLGAGKKPSVKFTLDPLPDDPSVKIYARCNRHDLWTTKLMDHLD